VVERPAGDSNAATWVDWTFYRVNLPARDLELAVRLEADRMQNLVLAQAQLESEREVVANERLMRVEDDIGGFLEEELFRWRLPATRTIGPRSDGWKTSDRCPWSRCESSIDGTTPPTTPPWWS